ncbi:hypothetical protein [Desulfofundulus sp.]|uniref:hypothetical protein n=1 Tax=Desulfofundulus sp. TaxID=2282750 RepID=UPI003C76E5FF
MKIIHICECCDQVVSEESVKSDDIFGQAQALTGEDSGDIMNVIVKYCLCDDCREMLYGPPGSLYYQRPHWLH